MVMQVVAGSPSGGASDQATVDVVLQMYTGGTIAALARIFTVRVQEAFAANETLATLIRLLPGTAVAVPVQVFTRPLGLATVNPAGRLSE